ncbi:Glucose-6-phosphate isomerase [Fusarium oxysporum f. sp. albedinis]|nr:Glucose-6-phosphate isomerase [Fusarium oxysporum f. sp. albedinis]
MGHTIAAAVLREGCTAPQSRLVGVWSSRRLDCNTPRLKMNVTPGAGIRGWNPRVWSVDKCCVFPPLGKPQGGSETWGRRATLATRAWGFRRIGDSKRV